MDWRSKTFLVHYRPELDGGGSVLAAPFVEFIRGRFARPFRRAFEWCAGPGFIGFSLLDEGLCDSLCLADINPDAVDCMRSTIRVNDLGGRVDCYLGDGLGAIPTHEKFDLVVANPPNFFAIHPDHPLFEELAGDLRPNDPGWQIHGSFYRNVKRHLLPGAVVCISEVEPYESKVFLEDPVRRMVSIVQGKREPVPLDDRPRPPVDDFRALIEEGGLRLDGIVPYGSVPGPLELSMVLSSLPDP